MVQVDIVIPVLNEGAYINLCLESVLAFEQPAEVECRVLVLDGGSVDDTKAIVNRILAQHPEVELHDNPGVIQSSALNIAIKKGKGDYLMRLDGHSSYPADYLKECLETAQRFGVDNVGGVFITVPGGDTYGAKLVQALTTHRFGVGDSGFRVGAQEGPADTVAYGFFKRDVFRRVGLFDERLVCSRTDVIRRVLRMVKDMLGDSFADYQFCDLGAGKGKALLIYAEMFGGSIAKFPALGIEYYGPLMDVCKENIERLGFRGKIEGYVDDARNLHSYTKSEKILLYLYNPFDWQILGAVLQKLTTGNTVIIYVDPVCSDQLLNLGYSKVKSKTGKYPNQCVTIFQKIV